MSYDIRIHEQAEHDLEALRPYDQRLILDEIEEQLKHQPRAKSRRKKCLIGLEPEFEHVSPVWQIRVGVFRVFYDVDEESHEVHVRAVRRKGVEDTTEEIT